MSKSIVVYLLLAPFAYGVHAQQSVAFKAHFSPQMTYDQTMAQTVKIETDADSGMVPTTRSMTMSLETTMQTGKLDNTQEMPLVLDIVKAQGPLGLPPLPRARAFGKVALDGVPVFDSLSASGLDSGVRNKVVHAMSKILSSLSLPKADVAVGGSYTQVIPIHLPIGGFNLTVNVSIKYTLMDVTAGMAHFNLAMTASIGMGSSPMPMPMAMPFKTGGEGKGTLVYDIKKAFIVQQDLGYTMAVNFPVGDKVTHLHLTMNFSNHCDISPRMN